MKCAAQRHHLLRPAHCTTPQHIQHLKLLLWSAQQAHNPKLLPHCLALSMAARVGFRRARRLWGSGLSSLIAAAMPGSTCGGARGPGRLFALSAARPARTLTSPKSLASSFVQRRAAGAWVVRSVLGQRRRRRRTDCPPACWTAVQWQRLGRRSWRVKCATCMPKAGDRRGWAWCWLAPAPTACSMSHASGRRASGCVPRGVGALVFRRRGPACLPHCAAVWRSAHCAAVWRSAHCAAVWRSGCDG